MTELRDIAAKIRSKNAGPFWLTIDIFCRNSDDFHRVSQGLSTEQVAALFKVAPEGLKRFDIEDLNVVKFSLPRPEIQGTRHDRDMHGASWAVLLEAVEVN
jgi:hypothetical protein